MKQWRINNDITDIINPLLVRDDNKRLGITVYEYKNFIVNLGEDESDIQEMSFTIDEMKNIYEFLKQYYE